MRMWIGTQGAGAGLFLYEGGTLRQYTTKQGLPSDKIHFITEDRSGRFWINGPAGLASFERSLTLVLREALQNAIRHASPTRIDTHLSFAPSLVEIQVEDDGCGFDVGASLTDDAHHYGLIGMREHVERHGGEFALSSEAGRGTRLRAALSCSGTTETPDTERQPEASLVAASSAATSGRVAAWRRLLRRFTSLRGSAGPSPP